MNPLRDAKKFGEKQINKLIGELIQNETFLQALEKIMTTKKFVDQQTEVVLNSVNIASKLESQDLADRLDQIDRQLRRLSKKLESTKEVGEETKSEVAALKAELAALKAASGDADTPQGDHPGPSMD